jgi:16S rRNA C967 or C1407 C5-methylase (RsmB/RsmF family)
MDGRLVYCVFTLSKKEGRNQVSEFIKTHDEFTLEKEVQLFPYDNLDSTCYYAILKKGAKLAKATPNIPESALLNPAKAELRAEGE